MHNFIKQQYYDNLQIDFSLIRFNCIIKQIIMKKEITLALCVIFCMLIECTSKEDIKKAHFPKIVWGYWHQGQQKASTFTKLCINNQRRYAEESGWKFNFLGPDTLHKFLDVDRVYQLWRMNGLMAPQVVADIIRMSLLLKYGGMWVDANSFFIEDFSWLDSLIEQPFIYHKYGDHPEVIIGSSTYNYMQSGTIYEIDYLPKIPNIQDWFMIAIPNSIFFNQVMKTIEHVLSIGRIQANKYYSALGVNNSMSQSDYFLMSNYIFQTILQLQQIKHDKKPRDNLPAMNHYKIWNIQAYKPIFTFLHFYKTTIKMFLSDMIYHNITTYRQKLGGLRYLIKFNSGQYKYINSVINEFSQNYCLGYISQIKKGSIFYQFLLTKLQNKFKNQNINQIMLSKEQRNCENVIQGQGSILFLFLEITILLLLIYAIYRTTLLEEYSRSKLK